MATPQEIQKLLDKLDKAYKQLGTKNPFKDWDSSNLKDAGEAAAQLEDALEGVQSRVENTSTSFKDLASTLGAIVKEIDPKAANATKSFANGFKNVIKEARTLQYEEEGINKLSKKQLEQVQERIKKQQTLTKAAAEELAGANANIDRQTTAYKDLIEAKKQQLIILKKKILNTSSIRQNPTENRPRNQN
jgi:ABC-type transporter Mla subunit MlaD